MSLACISATDLPAATTSPDVFVSTYAFPVKKLAEIIDLAAGAGIRNIELSSGMDHEPDLEALLERGLGLGQRYLVHNYFPAPPNDPFVLNLASGQPEIRARSIEHCLRSIELSKRLGAQFYSVHAGFAFDPAPAELGRRLGPHKLLPLEEAYRLFVDSVQQLTECAARRGIGLAIENHALTAASTPDGVNRLVLMVQAEDLLRLADDIHSPHLGFLVDVGHLAVSARTMGFSPEKFLEAVGERTLALHLSENDGLTDQNLPVDARAWFIPALPRLRGTAMILECGPASIDAIQSSCTAIQEGLRACRQEWKH